MPRVAVLAPKEERFGRGSGAVAHWILSTSTSPDFDTSVIGIRARGHVGADSVIEPRLYKVLLLCADLAKRHGISLLERACRKALQDDRLWVLSTLLDLMGSDLVHIHNRPTYAPLLRQCGYRGQIVLHMHNDLLNYLPTDDEARSKILAACTSFVFCSDFIAGVASAALSESQQRRSRVIANGADDVSPTSSRRSRSTYKLLVAGRVIESKGVLEAVEICRALRDLGPYELLVAGPLGTDGGGELNSYSLRVLDALSTCVDDQGQGFAHYMGEVSRNELGALMDECLALLMPVRWDEPFGMVAVEAMSHGLPVIASPRGGLPSVLDHGRAGILADDLDDQVSAVRHLAVGSNWDAISRAAARHFTTHFRWQVIRQELAELWTESLEGPSHRDQLRSSHCG